MKQHLLRVVSSKANLDARNDLFNSIGRVICRLSLLALALILLHASKVDAKVVITNVSASSITTSNATINWGTNVPSTTQVEYGLTSSYGSLSVLNSTMVTSHQSALSSLLSGILYHYRVKSKDKLGNMTVSTDKTFTTVGADPPPVITNVQTSGTTSNETNVTWNTNEGASSQVDYGKTTAYGSSTTLDSALLMSHQTSISGLSTSTLYHYRVRSADSGGNLSVSSDFTFQTSAAPPPVLSNIQATGITATTATIQWNTNVLSTSQVDYGPTTSYGSNTSNQMLVTTHSVSLSGLIPGMLYHYRVTSVDSYGTPSTSTDYTFSTGATGNIYYVSVTGNDSNPGTVGLPFRTIDRGCNALGAGDTLRVRAGVYNEIVTVPSTASGTSSAYTIIESYPGETAIIDGTGTTADTTLFQIGGSGRQYIWIRNFEIRNATRSGINTSAGASHIKLTGSYIHDCVRGGIYFSGATDAIIDSNELYHNCLMNQPKTLTGGWPYNLGLANGSDRALVTNNIVHESYGEGIGLGQTNYAVIRGNKVWDNFSVNIYVDNSQFDVVDGNFIYGNNSEYYRSGYSPYGISTANEGAAPALKSDDNTYTNNIIVNCRAGFRYSNTGSGGGAKRIKFFNNTIYQTQQYTMSLDSADCSGSQFENNIIYDIQTGGGINNMATGTTWDYNNWFGVTGWIAGAHDVNADPKLVNPGPFVAANYAVQSTSPAINVGLALSATLTVDYFGTPRPQGLTFDIGASEWK